MPRRLSLRLEAVEEELAKSSITDNQEAYRCREAKDENSRTYYRDEIA